ncbi:MAG: porin [Gammaproteobacteria bacterium]|nr:porin [Gammaproteobacteria bacterium]
MRNRVLLLLLLVFPQWLSAAVDEARIEQLEAQIEALADMLEQGGSGVATQATQFGSYGELHYQANEKGNNKIDFHRWVLFMSHEFSEKIRFFSELEVEHAMVGEGQAGALELEQSYISLTPRSGTEVKLGLFLLPIGIINETHEPPRFYGVERNPIEKIIVPATWWESGAMLSQQFASGISYDVALHSGLNVSDSVDLRKGRQRSANANGNAWAVTGRLNYSGLAGLLFSLALQHQSDLNQSASDSLGAAQLYESHLVWQSGALSLKALYAVWNIEGRQARLLKKDRQQGGYLEAAYRLNPQWGVFVRQNSWQTVRDIDQEQLDFGVNWWLHEDVVVKLDYQQSNQSAGDLQALNLGVGYQF